jgi:hypothetical protein
MSPLKIQRAIGRAVRVRQAEPGYVADPDLRLVLVGLSASMALGSQKTAP